MENIDKILYMFWTGDNPLTDNRKKSIELIKNTSGLKVIILDKNTIFDFELQNNRFHGAYKYLSAVHKSDYLRAYFMNFYGGCYSDIKPNIFNWLPYVNILENNPYKDVVGYSEEKPEDIGIEENDPEQFNMRKKYFIFSGNCSYICKKNSFITNLWYKKITNKLDEKMPLLQKFPAQEPRDFNNKIINGIASQYPIKWTEICGNIFHKICWLNNDRFLNILPRPICYNYQ